MGAGHVVLGRSSFSLALLLALISHGSAQVWQTGDNSTIEGCSSHCSIDNDGDLPCWMSTLRFFEASLITQLRHYISVQVDIDQWHRRHGSPDGQDPKTVAAEIMASFEAELTSKDTLSNFTVHDVAVAISDRVAFLSDHTLTSVPHFRCPLPCEYRHDMYRNLFIASIVLNVALLASVIPHLFRSLRPEEDDGGREALIQNGHANKA